MKNTRATKLHPVAEILESRIAPATVTAPGVFDYTDADGDSIKVKLEGTFGTVDFFDAGGNDVSVANSDIATIVIAGAGPTFSLTFADTNTGGDNVVKLGKIAGVDGARLPLIGGVFTVPTADGSLRYDLDGFRGAGFSKGGGMTINGTLTGSATDAAGLDLTNLPKTTQITISNGIAGGATALIGQVVAGEISIGGALDGTLTVGTLAGQMLLDEVAGSVVIQKSSLGRIFVEEVSGLFEIQGSTGNQSRITASGDMNLRVVGTLIGTVAVAGDLKLTVDRDIFRSEILVGENLTLDVGRSIINSRAIVQELLDTVGGIRGDIFRSSLVGGTGLILEVERAVSASRLSSGTEDMTLNVGTALNKVQIVGGDDISLSVGGSVTGSRILPDGQLDAAILGSVSSTQIGSQSSSAFISVGGKMFASKLVTGEDATLEVAGGIEKLTAAVGANAVFETPKNITSASVTAGSDIRVLIGGSLMSSTLLPGNALEAVVGKNVSGNTLASFDNSTSLDVGGTISRTTVESGDGISVIAAGIENSAQMRASGDVDVSASARMNGFIIAAGDVSVATPGIVGGTISAGQNLTLVADTVNIRSAQSSGGTSSAIPSSSAVAGGSSTQTPVPSEGSASALIIGVFRGIRVGGDLQLDVVNNFAAPFALIGGDVLKLEIGGNFKGTFIAGGDLRTGDAMATTVVVAGEIGKTSLIQIKGDVGSADSSPELIFGGALLGRFEIGGNLQTDLTFDAGLSQLNIQGAIGPSALGDNIVDIVVQGTLGRLKSSSLFQRTDSASGTFVDSVGTVTGRLIATIAAINVLPEDFTA